MATRFPLGKSEYGSEPDNDGSYLQGYWYGALHVPSMESSLVGEVRKRIIPVKGYENCHTEKFEFFVSWERFDGPGEKVTLVKGESHSYKAAVKALHEASEGQRALIDAMKVTHPEGT